MAEKKFYSDCLNLLYGIIIFAVNGYLFFFYFETNEWIHLKLCCQSFRHFSKYLRKNV